MLCYLILSYIILGSLLADAGVHANPTGCHTGRGLGGLRVYYVIIYHIILYYIIIFHYIMFLGLRVLGFRVLGSRRDWGLRV